MTPNELVPLIANVGFPIAVAIWLLIGLPKLTDAIHSLEDKVDRLITITEYQAGLRQRKDV
jgi:hypothetical protein